MKTYKNLFNEIATFENLYAAYLKAAVCKRNKIDVLDFAHFLEINLCQLRDELLNQSYKPGGYQSFLIYEPKPRLISKAPFRDRVVHHALMNVIGPLLEKSLVFDSYANRVGKGTHRAIQRYQYFSRRFSYALKCDIHKFFPSIDFAVLKSLIRRKIACRKTLWLIETIIDNSNEQEPVQVYFPGDTLFTPIERRKGLPIGNLTSQFFANYYLNPLDHFIKEKLHCKGYVRYVDDFVLFANDKKQLGAWKRTIAVFLQDYRLLLHPRQCHIYPVQTGRRFLGQVVFPGKRRLTGENVRRFRRRLRQWTQHPPENIEARLAAWLGHARQADTESLLATLFSSYPTPLTNSIAKKTS